MRSHKTFNSVLNIFPIITTPIPTNTYLSSPTLRRAKTVIFSLLMYALFPHLSSQKGGRPRYVFISNLQCSTWNIYFLVLGRSPTFLPLVT